MAPDASPVLRFTGYLDIGRYPEFRAAFERLPPELPVLVDLRDATGVDSTFISELLLFRRRRRPHRVVVVLRRDTDVARTFALAGVAGKLDVYADLDAAYEALGA